MVQAQNDPVSPGPKPIQDFKLGGRRYRTWCKAISNVTSSEAKNEIRNDEFLGARKLQAAARHFRMDVP